MYGLSKFGAGLGLHRILRFCDERNIDLDHLSSVSIVVTGSKGKGSTTRFTYDAVRSVFPDTGCFISPHLYNVTERYEFAGEPILPSVFEEHKREVLVFAARLADEGDSLGEFELLFLIAVSWFDRLRPRAIVWEAGIGGRYDPVRALQAPFSVLTSVELEHTDLLGPTLELIAYDKLDAVRPGGTVFVSPAVDAKLYDRLRAFGRITGKTVSFLAEDRKITRVETSVHGTSYTFADAAAREFDVALSLIGAHQAHNSLTALAVAAAYAGERAPGFSFAGVIAALRRTAWPGRLERISIVPDVWIDVGHTPESVRVVLDEFRRLYRASDVTVIFGVSYNKAIDEIAAIVEARFDQIVLTRANKNGLDVAELKKHFRDPAKIVACHNDVVDAVAAVRSAAQPRTVIVAGGLFLAAEFAHAWRGGDPKDLVFF